MMKRYLYGLTTMGIVLVVGCVNIPNKFEAHITVDIRHHIEQQAGSTLDYIEGKTESLPEHAANKAGEGKTSWLEKARAVLSPIQPVYAAELKDSSPEITRIATELRKRFDQIAVLKQNGCTGESNRGYVELRNLDKLRSADERNAAQRLIAAENADRKALYQEVARLNADQKVSVSMVESIYAVERLKRARPGELFQLPEGTVFDRFKETDVAKRLGSEAVAGTWVTIK